MERLVIGAVLPHSFVTVCVLGWNVFIEHCDVQSCLHFLSHLSEIVLYLHWLCAESVEFFTHCLEWNHQICFRLAFFSGDSVGAGTGGVGLLAALSARRTDAAHRSQLAK